MVSSLSSARRELEKLAGGTRDKKHPTRGAGAAREVAGTKDGARAPEPIALGEGPSPGCAETSVAGQAEGYSEPGRRPWRRSCPGERWDYRGSQRKHRSVFSFCYSICEFGVRKAFSNGTQNMQ